MKRVTYTTNDDGDLVSNLFPLHSDMAFVIIFVKEKKYQIRVISDEGTVRILSECSGKDVNRCRDLARKELISLGVKFKDMIKNRG